MLSWQVLPPAARHEHVDETFDYLPDRRRAAYWCGLLVRPTGAGWGREKRLDEGPLGVTAVNPAPYRLVHWARVSALLLGVLLGSVLLGSVLLGSVL
jgi:hypothetical protein